VSLILRGHADMAINAEMPRVRAVVAERSAFTEAAAARLYSSDVSALQPKADMHQVSLSVS
jgi:hypothetical protein